MIDGLKLTMTGQELREHMFENEAEQSEWRADVLDVGEHLEGGFHLEQIAKRASIAPEGIQITTVTSELSS